MAKKEFLYRGKNLEELKAMSPEDFAHLLPSRQRRSVLRMLNAREGDPRLILYKKIKKRAGNLKTHCRDFVILPEMVGMVIQVHNGKEFQRVEIKDKMIGHFLGEFALTRKFIQHSAPGIGASRSTKFVSVRV